jgi:uncharacterized repeat protein (TIGR01451 family)
MKHNFFSGSGPVVKGLMASIISLMLLAVFVLPNTVQASTVSGTTVSNTATVNYKSTGGTPYSGTSSLTLTVSLVNAAPIVTWVSQTPVATSGSPADESALVTQTYGIYSQANGVAQYTVNTPTYTPTTIGAATVGTLPSPFYLGATTVAIKASAGTVVYVPYVAATDSSSQIGGANGIVVNDKVWINGAAYTVSAIDLAVAAGGAVPTDLGGKVSKITLSTAFTGSDLNPGTIIPEYQTFAVPVTTGVFTAPNTSGSYAGSLTVHDNAGTPNTSTAASSSIYVAAASLTILKEVSVGCSGTYVPTSANATPGQEVCYRLTVTNNSSTQTVNTVSVTDALSPYVAFKMSGSPTIVFTEGSPASGLTDTTASATYTDQANAAYTPLVSSGGGAPANYDANVHSWTVNFNGATSTMAASGKFTLVYHVWLY